ncbi:MAG: hypothetical protein AAFY63_04405 [Cyanobacteria bacterium J06643_13]
MPTASDLRFAKALGAFAPAPYPYFVVLASIPLRLSATRGLAAFLLPTKVSSSSSSPTSGVTAGS